METTPKPKFERGQKVRLNQRNFQALRTVYHIFNPAEEHREAWPDSGRVFKDGQWHYLLQEKMFSGILYKESELIAV